MSQLKETQMKGNIKKLAVFVIVAVLAMFIVVAAASAWWPARNALWGQYAVTGGGACVSCPPGTIDITKDVFLLGGCTNYSPDVVEGVYTFYTNNTGTFKGTLRILMFDAAGVPLFGASMDTEWTFKY